MSTSCSHSSKQKKLLTEKQADLFFKYTHNNSPPPSTPPLLAPSLKHNSKWRAVLALLPSRSTRSLTAQASSSASTSSPPELHIECASSHPQLARKRTVDSDPLAAHITSPNHNSHPHLATPECKTTVDADQPIATHHSEAASNSNNLLHMFLKGAYSDDIEGQIRTLDALCTLCADMPSVADRCVAAGGVEIILNILNTSTARTRSPAASAEENEKALHLLHLITASSEDGCAAALRHSSSMISILGKKLLRISEACTASAVTVLSTLCYHSDAALFRKALSETAIPSKLVVVLQVASEDSTKQKAGRLLRIITNK